MIQNYVKIATGIKSVFRTFSIKSQIVYTNPYKYYPVRAGGHDDDKNSYIIAKRSYARDEHDNDGFANKYTGGQHYVTQPILPPKRKYRPKDVDWNAVKRCEPIGQCEKGNKPDRADELHAKLHGPKQYRKLPIVFPHLPPTKQYNTSAFVEEEDVAFDTICHNDRFCYASETIPKENQTIKILKTIQPVKFFHTNACLPKKSSIEGISQTCKFDPIANIDKAVNSSYGKHTEEEFKNACRSKPNLPQKCKEDLCQRPACGSNPNCLKLTPVKAKGDRCICRDRK